MHSRSHLEFSFLVDTFRLYRFAAIRFVLDFFVQSLLLWTADDVYVYLLVSLSHAIRQSHLMATIQNL